MCNPVFAIMAVSAVVSAMGAAQQTKAANEAAKFQSQVAANNEQTANMYAEDAITRAQIEADDHRRKIAQVKGDQLASIAASGFDVGQGSALDILGDTAAMGELDILRIKDNGAREAAKYRQQGANFGAEAQLAANSKKSVGLAVGTSLLSSASSGASQYSSYKYNQKGVG